MGTGSWASIRADWCRCWWTTGGSSSRATTSWRISRRASPSRSSSRPTAPTRWRRCSTPRTTSTSDLRAISFRYFFPGAGPRPRELQDQYEAAGSGTVGGEPDPHKAVELAFYADVTANGGISDARLRIAVERFASALAALEARLADGPYLMGGSETLLDIAWYIYCFRLVTSGYPLRERHPRLGAWFDGLHAREAFRREVAEPPPLVAMRKAMQAEQGGAGHDPRAGRGAVAWPRSSSSTSS